MCRLGDLAARLTACPSSRPLNRWYWYLYKRLAESSFDYDTAPDGGRGCWRALPDAAAVSADVLRDLGRELLWRAWSRAPAGPDGPYTPAEIGRLMSPLTPTQVKELRGLLRQLEETTNDSTLTMICKASPDPLEGPPVEVTPLYDKSLTTVESRLGSTGLLGGRHYKTHLYGIDSDNATLETMNPVVVRIVAYLQPPWFKPEQQTEPLDDWLSLLAACCELGAGSAQRIGEVRDGRYVPDRYNESGRQTPGDEVRSFVEPLDFELPDFGTLDSSTVPRAPDRHPVEVFRPSAGETLASVSIEVLSFLLEPLGDAQDGADRSVERGVAGSGAAADDIEAIKRERDAHVLELSRLQREGLTNPTDLIAEEEERRRLRKATKQTPGAGKAAATGQAPAVKLTGEARALAVLTQHPGWTMRQIAEAVGMKRQTLYRYERLIKARNAMRGVGQAKYGKRSELR